MITPMTKLTMLIYHRDYNKFLNDLRDHGVVHVHTKKQTLQDENMKAKMSEVKHPDNYTMHMCLDTCFTIPTKSTMSKINMYALRK